MNLLDLALQKPNTTAAKPYDKNAVHPAPIATIGLQRPLRPERSYLVREPLYKAPSNFVKDIVENLKNIKSGITGKSNDHDLGRINDFAMKAGALGLAGYLFTKAKTPTAKTMELFGFGAFFASMALWPKFMQVPTQIKYGLDVQQKYVDNEGRQKRFFQDPQYIPWDLYTPEEMTKLGDNLGIPKDIHNRNEVTKRKAHKIAVQNNTLWMLTAGFATPLGAALGCNAAEKFVVPALEKIRTRKAWSDLQKADKIVEKESTKHNPARLNSILKVYTGQEIDKKLLNKMVKGMLYDHDIMAREAIKNQLTNILKDNKGTATTEYAQRFVKYITEAMKIHQFNVDDTMKADILQFAGKDVDPIKFHEKTKRYIFEKSGNDIKVVHHLTNITRKFMLSKTNTDVLKLTDEAAERIRELDKQLFDFAAHKRIIDKYNTVYLGDVAESVAANSWNRVTGVFFKALNLSEKELLIAKYPGEVSYNILEKKMTELAGNDEAYKKAVKNIQAEILKFDKAILPEAVDGKLQGVMSTLNEKYTSLLDGYAEKFTALGFDDIVKRLVGDEITAQGSLKPNVLDRASRRIFSLRSGFYKILNVMDCFKRLSSPEQFNRQYKEFTGHIGKVTETPSPEEISRLKKIVLSATVSEHTTKFGFNNAQAGLYNRVMKLIYNTDFADATKEVLVDEKLGDTTFMKAFTNKINEALFHIGRFEYPHANKVRVFMDDNNRQVGDILVRDSLVGPRMDNIFRETASNVYNTRTWLKMFGWGAVALVGVSWISQLFFGRLNPKEVHLRKDGV